MPEDMEKPEEKSNEGKLKAASKSKGLPFIIIVAAVAFVIAIGVFSLILGVFSSTPTANENSKKSGQVTAKQADEGDSKLTELEKLEKELDQVDGVADAEDMDDLMDLVEAEEEQEQLIASGMSKEDSVTAVEWLKGEKTKLAKERADLEQLKSDLDKQEYQFKQLITQVNQIESARINALARLYDGMKADQVAPLLNKLTEEQAVQVLLKMKPANAAKILGSLSPDRAASISARMITLSGE